MNEQTLKDKNGKTIAVIRETNGRLEIRRFGGPLLGFYDPKQNVTRDANNKLIARYNALTELIK
jgi:hypothetical protein